MLFCGCRVFAAPSRRQCTIGATAKACKTPRIRILEPCLSAWREKLWLLALPMLSRRHRQPIVAAREPRKHGTRQEGCHPCRSNLVPKLQLGNAFPEAPASRMRAKQEL